MPGDPIAALREAALLAQDAIGQYCKPGRYIAKPHRVVSMPEALAALDAALAASAAPVDRAAVRRALEIGRWYVDLAVKDAGGYEECEISYRTDLDEIDEVLSALAEADGGEG